MVDRSPMKILLGARSSKFGNDLFQSTESNLSACARRRYQCLSSFVLSHRSTIMAWTKLFRPGCTALFDVLRDGKISSHHSCSKSIYRCLLRNYFFILLKVSLSGTSPRGVEEIRLHLNNNAFLLVRLPGARTFGVDI